MGVTDNSLVIFVTGQLQLESNPPIHFAQMFQLVATGPGQYYVHNEVFRLTVA
jgi:Nuclear transport factor 2 (NTF2) domain